ncbi:prepilin-type N-terminal cleavage/methylation domain-containing protein [Thermosulfurimonas marina]|uniref:Prepilin-type N-terminal cleavage/methylation domain-containing protein n=1 Tax=Thermosulfurimonas marina TaxID=2047767 RepID=A0A6H1WQY7_9BACT|nr:prepilin-type N-terminal cleavage/methylation domain-containing protein [Thermosulfurimonas marina]QJA05603.1 prepilin-type N-terminal cleavage/methylation domain-containing protein [Thermosulfurimonas marina]
MSCRIHEKGFTLVELAIVLVIIGILLGAVLKGQELINNARIRRVQSDLKGIEALVWSFFDRYGRMPGDCNKDGIIDARVNNSVSDLDNDPDTGFCASTAPDGDRDRPWAELKQAQLLPPDADNRDLSRHVFNGRFFIGRANTGGTTYVNAISVVDLPCFAAKAIDASIDGNIDAGKGRVRRLTGAYTASTTSDPTWGCASEEDLVDLVYFFDKLP